MESSSEEDDDAHGAGAGAGASAYGGPTEEEMRGLRIYRALTRLTNNLKGIYKVVFQIGEFRFEMDCTVSYLPPHPHGHPMVCRTYSLAIMSRTWTYSRSCGSRPNAWAGRRRTPRPRPTLRGTRTCCSSHPCVQHCRGAGAGEAYAT